MFLGKDGFIWWVGVIEDIEDELLLGRAKVRIFGYHADFDSGRLSTEDLPYATVIMPANIPNAYGRLELGDWVFGFFLDATEANEPAILGYIPGIPSPDAKNFGRYKKPNRSFYNTTQSTANSHSITTRSGHSLQFVDTPGSESVTLNASARGVINIQRGNSRIQMLENGTVEIVANNITLNTGTKGDVSVTGRGGTFSVSQKFSDLDRINASQNTQIEIAKTLP
jgi:hypothetical protein